MTLAVRVRTHRLVKAIDGHPAERAVTHGQSRTHSDPPEAHVIVLFGGLNDSGSAFTSGQSEVAVAPTQSDFAGGAENQTSRHGLWPRFERLHTCRIGPAAATIWASVGAWGDGPQG